MNRPRRLLAAAMVVGLLAAACGDDDDSAADTASEDTSSETAGVGTDGGTTTDEAAGTAPTSGAATTASAESGAPGPADGEPIRVGAVLPDAGVYGQLGPDIADGMALYLDSVGNEAAGRPIELITESEPQDPNGALDATRRLLDSDIDVLTGFVSTASIYAARDLIDERGIPTIVSNAGGNELTADRFSESIFRVSFTSDQVSAPLGTWVAENIGTRVAIVASDYAFGQESAAAFRSTFEAAGGEIVQEVFTPLGSDDFSAAITEIAASDAEATFGFLAGSDGVIFVQQYADSGIAEDKPLTVAGFMTSSDVLDAVGDRALGAISSLHYAPTLDNPANQEFAPAFEEAYGRQPSVYAVQGYDAAQYLVAAVEETGGDTTPGALIEALETVSIESPRGPVAIDPETHQITQHMYVREVQEVDGRLTNVVTEDLGEVGADPLGSS